MTRLLLVPLDGSSFGEHAVVVASVIARRTAAAIELVHVHEPLWLPRDGTPTIDPTLDRDQRRETETWLAQRAARLAAESGLEVHATFMVGDVVQALERHIRERGSDLVVMTTHGRDGISRAWLGSVADAVVRSTSVPVLLIRATDDAPAHNAGEFHRILVPLDGSDLAASILEPTLALAPHDDAEFVLLTVVEPPLIVEPFPDVAIMVDRAGVARAQQAALTSSVQAAEAYLGPIANDLRRRTSNAKAHVAVNPQPARGILDYAVEIKADLIALATHGRSGLARVFVGSVADKVVRGAHLPVLICRPAVSGDAGSPKPSQAAAREDL